MEKLCLVMCVLSLSTSVTTVRIALSCKLDQALLYFFHLVFFKMNEVLAEALSSVWVNNVTRRERIKNKEKNSMWIT